MGMTNENIDRALWHKESYTLILPIKKSVSKDVKVPCWLYIELKCAFKKDTTNIPNSEESQTEKK